MDQTKARAAAATLADLAQDGGGTYEAETYLPFRPTSGFAVGIGGARIPAAAYDIQTAYWLLRAVSTEYEANYVGTWLDGGMVHVDAVRYIRDLSSAVVLARAMGQEAIYDFGDRISIYVEELA